MSLKYILQLIDQNVLREELPTVLGVIIVKAKTSKDPQQGSGSALDCIHYILIPKEFSRPPGL